MPQLDRSANLRMKKRPDGDGLTEVVNFMGNDDNWLAVASATRTHRNCSFGFDV